MDLFAGLRLVWWTIWSRVDMYNRCMMMRIDVSVADKDVALL